jgi:hypothetical protein
MAVRFRVGSSVPSKSVQAGLKQLMIAATQALRGSRGQCLPREVSTIAQTAAKLAPLLTEIPSFIAALLKSLTTHAADLDSQGLANALHALATMARLDEAFELGLGPEELKPAVRALAEAAVVAAPRQRPQELANTCMVLQGCPLPRHAGLC